MNTSVQGFRVVVALALGLWIAPAFAAVTLTTTVQKIAPVKTADGTVASQLVPADQVLRGDEIKYTIVFKNDAKDPIDGIVVITNPVPENTAYVADTALGSGTKIEFSVDGAKSFGCPDDLTVVRDGVTVPASSDDYTTIKWTYASALGPAAQSYVSFNVRLK